MKLIKSAVLHLFKTTFISLDSIISLDSVSLLTVSSSSAIIVTQNDEVYYVERLQPELGDYGEYDDIVKIKKMTQLCGQSIKKVFLKNSSALAITSTGKLYIWGIIQSFSGKKVETYPELIKDLNVLDADFGIRHVMVLTTEKTVACWGFNTGLVIQ